MSELSGETSVDAGHKRATRTSAPIWAAACTVPKPTNAGLILVTPLRAARPSSRALGLGHEPPAAAAIAGGAAVRSRPVARGVARPPDSDPWPALFAHCATSGPRVARASFAVAVWSGIRPSLGYMVMNSTSVIVWLPLASIARTSTLYWVPGSRNSAGMVTLVVVAGRSTLNTRRGFSRSTMT